MIWLTKIPFIGDLLQSVMDRFLPDKNAYREKVLEIELEETRQSKGRITPRMLLKYIIAIAVGLNILISLLVFVFPEYGPVPPLLKEIFPLAGLLFGFGG